MLSCCAAVSKSAYVYSPVKPGEIGGSYKPLTQSQMEAIEENIFRILEEIGFNDATPHCIEKCIAIGAILGEDGRLRMPREVVKKAMNQSFLLQF